VPYSAIFCTEPFRIPYASKLDICCCDKTSTNIQESILLDGVAGAGFFPALSFRTHLPVKTAINGAPKTVSTFPTTIPAHYDNIYKWFTRRGACVLALGWREGCVLSNEKVNFCKDRVR